MSLTMPVRVLLQFSLISLNACHSALKDISDLFNYTESVHCDASRTRPAPAKLHQSFTLDEPEDKFCMVTRVAAYRCVYCPALNVLFRVESAIGIALNYALSLTGSRRRPLSNADSSRNTIVSHECRD